MKPRDVAACVVTAQRAYEAASLYVKLKQFWISISDSSLAKGNRQHPWTVLLPDHPAKEHCFSQKCQ